MADHNSARWLKVEYRAKRLGRIGWGLEPGWFVVRTCPCHPNKPVTLALPGEAAAQRAMALLLRFDDTPALPKDAPGFVGRRNNGTDTKDANTEDKATAHSSRSLLLVAAHVKSVSVDRQPGARPYRPHNRTAHRRSG